MGTRNLKLRNDKESETISTHKTEYKSGRTLRRERRAKERRK